MNERRLFLGIPIVGKSRTRLSQVISAWGDLPVFPIRPENLHAEVLPLGFVTDEHAAELADIAEEVCADFEPFDISFQEIAMAPEGGSAKTIRLVGEESAPMLVLRNALERELMGKTAEGKRFRPHVTLARVKRHEFASLLETKLAMFPQPVSLSEPVSSVILYESIGSGAKQQYLSMGEFPLGQ